MDRLLGPPLNEAERAAVLAHARALLGTPWRHKGRTERGADCLHFLWMTLDRAMRDCRGEGVPPPRNDYGKTPHNRKLREGMIEYLGAPAWSETGIDPQPFDAITMRWNGEEHHVGLLVPHHHHRVGLIHADNTAAGGGRVVEHGCDAVWERRFVEGFRL